MPHQCTECARTFPDGSKEMLSGCPDCGGNKFQFKPSDAVDVGAGTEGAGGGVGNSSPGGDDDGGAMSRAKATVRDLMGRGSGDDADGGTSGSNPGQASLSEYSNDDVSASSATGGSAADTATAADGTSAADAASAADGASGAGSGTTTSDDDDGAMPSGSGAWPKSGTEEYDTPAERAERREARDQRGSDETPSRDEASERKPSRDEASRREPQGDDASSPQESPAESRSASESGAGASEAASGDGSITAQMGETEDDAQRSARSDVVSPDELPNRDSSASAGVADDDTADPGATRADRPPSSDAADVKDRPSAGDVASERDAESPDLNELREELNSQFESIKVLDPGKYELNLMELYDREEYIISLQEDGRYVIEVPESWRGDAGPD